MKNIKQPLRRLALAMTLGGAIAAARAVAVEAQPNLPLLDEQGRQLIPSGYVALEKVPYTPDDYRRMVRAATADDREQAALIKWDDDTQHFIVEQ